VTHCAVIFWPRKPLKIPTDENGLPILWCNENEQKENVACVWWEDSDDVVLAEKPKAALPSPVTSFSNTVSPLQTGSEAPASRRSVA
jgi:hypothetical protein